VGFFGWFGGAYGLGALVRHGVLVSAVKSHWVLGIGSRRKLVVSGWEL
jgi:hypothetical protein